MATHTKQIYVDLLQKNIEARNQDNPTEVAIRSRIRDLILQSSWAHDAFEQITLFQLEQLQKALEHFEKGDTDTIKELSQYAFSHISTLYKSHFADEDSKKIVTSAFTHGGVLVTTNHLGLYKLCGIETDKVKVSIPKYPQIYPYWAYSAGLHPLADMLDASLTYVSNQFPDIFHQVHQASGFVHVPFAHEKGVYGAVRDQVKDIIETSPNTLIVYFPEGTTSGKPNASDPYHLAPFHRGVYVLAHDLDIPRILVGQFFHPEKGLMIKVIEASHVPTSHNPKKTYAAFAARDQKLLQSWLDTMVAETHPEILQNRRADT